MGSLSYSLDLSQEDVRLDLGMPSHHQEGQASENTGRAEESLETGRGRDHVLERV